MITLVASSPVRGSGASSASLGATLGAANAAGDTLVAVIINRTDESTTINAISDSVNGAWPAPVAGPVASIGTTFYAWAYVLENASAGTPALSVTFSGPINSEVLFFALHGSTDTPEVDVLGTTYNTAGATETEIDTANMAATAAGLAVGLFTLNVFQGSGPTLNGAGESSVLASAGGMGRTFGIIETVSGAGNVNFDLTLASASRVIGFQMTFVEGGGGTPPSVSNVNGGTSITLDASGQIANGSDFSNPTAELDQGDFTGMPLAVSSSNSSTVTFSALSSGGAPRPKHGAAVFRVVNEDELEDTLSVDIIPISGSDYVDVSSVSSDPEARVLQFDTPPDAGDQIQWRVDQLGYDETSVNVNDDCTFDFEEGLESFEIRVWDETDGSWSEWVEQFIDQPATDWEAAGYANGIAVSADGIIGTHFLEEGQSPPAGSSYINGFAVTADGRLCITTWPSDDDVSYERGIARDPQGAMIITSLGSISGFSSGWALTYRGEVLVTEDTPEVVYNGVGLRNNGVVCVETLT